MFRDRNGAINESQVEGGVVFACVAHGDYCNRNGCAAPRAARTSIDLDALVFDLKPYTGNANLDYNGEAVETVSVASEAALANE